MLSILGIIFFIIAFAFLVFGIYVSFIKTKFVFYNTKMMFFILALCFNLLGTLIYILELIIKK